MLCGISPDIHQPKIIFSIRFIFPSTPSRKYSATVCVFSDKNRCVTERSQRPCRENAVSEGLYFFFFYLYLEGIRRNSCKVISAMRQRNNNLMAGCTVTQHSFAKHGPQIKKEYSTPNDLLMSVH